MKKFFLTTAILCLSAALYGCGETEAKSTENATNDTAVVEEQQTSEDNEQSDSYFKDNVFMSEDVKIEITDYKVIPVGEPGNEYGQKPVIAFWYNTTNLSGEDITPSTAWILVFTAIQDNDPNAINELNMSITTPDKQFTDSQMETIKQNGTVANAIAYELDDDVTPVTLQATDPLMDEIFGEQEFAIQ